MIRLFVALPFPIEVRDRLVGLMGGVPGARWTAGENLHLTLRFIGEVPGDRVGEIDDALAGVTGSAFPLVFDGVGVFGSGRRVRVLWAGVERNEALLRLQAKVESALARSGLPAEERRFSPHVTLAGLKGAPQERVGRFVAERALFRAGPFTMDRFVLFRSRPGHTGPVYDALSEYPLAIPPGLAGSAAPPLTAAGP
jgi:2'-5' RNA ligase